MIQFSRTRLFIGIASILLTPLVFAAEDDNVSLSMNDAGEIVFTANQVSSDITQVGSSINVVNRKMIEKAQYRSVSDALKTLSGVTLVEASSSGTSSVFIRGASSEHTLVLIDGVVVNDPSTPGRSFNFAGLDTLDIERIEVLKGPQSTLYGSDAMGGVVQIFTKQGGKQKTILHVEGGGYDNITTSIQTRGQTDRWQYSVAAGLEQERGISAADVKLGNVERDRMKNRTASINLNYAPIDQLNFDFIVRYNRFYNDYDAFAGEGGDERFLHQKSHHWLGRFAINAYLFDEKLETTLSYDISDLRRRIHNGPDGVAIPDAPEIVVSELYEKGKYHGRTQTFAWRNTLTLHKDFVSRFGITHMRENAKTYYYSETPDYSFESELPRKRSELTSGYWDQHLDFGNRFFNTVGVRYDHHPEFGDAFTYRATSRFNINKYVSIKGSIGTGYKAPTLYQLYEPTYGNNKLQPERSRGYDIGFVFYPHRSTELSLTYFHQKYKNLINFEDDTYVNIGRAETKGFEFSSQTRLNDQWAFGFNYTYLDAKNTTDDERLKRRPRHQVGSNINFSPNTKSNFFIEGTYYSSRIDTNYTSYPSEDVKLKPYWMVNLAASYQITPQVKISARVNNLLDKKYTTIYGYGQKRINGYVGITIDL